MGDNLIRIWSGQLWVFMYIVAYGFNVNSSYLKQLFAWSLFATCKTLVYNNEACAY